MKPHTVILPTLLCVLVVTVALYIGAGAYLHTLWHEDVPETNPKTVTYLGNNFYEFQPSNPDWICILRVGANGGGGCYPKVKEADDARR